MVDSPRVEPTTGEPKELKAGELPEAASEEPKAE
jgi:hypothetical protein